MSSEILQEVDRLLDRAEKAIELFRTYATPQVQKIIQAMAESGAEKAQFYAEWLVRETGCGSVNDNVKKNLDCSIGLLERYNPQDFIEPIIDDEKKILSIPKPAGIIAALLPSTNPVMTAYYKAIVAMMTRNTIIFSPHPVAKECSIHLVDFLAKVAEKAGAPQDSIQIVKYSGRVPLKHLMESPRIALILATGGPNRVSEAYSSGNPAIGMGPGNVPCFVHNSADISIAAKQIIASNSFDNALACVCESVVIADRAISDRLKTSISNSGGYFVKGEELQKLRSYLFMEGKVNSLVQGKSAVWIAEKAGFSVPEETKSLLVEIDAVGWEEPLSQEKLFPVMGYITVDGVESAIQTALVMLEMIGKGHSAVIHSNDLKAVALYTEALPVCRIAVNTQGVEGSSGVSTNLTRSPIIATGFFGGSSVDENVGPQSLVQWSRAAYPKDSKISIRHF
ncbi:MAG: aldehyde dehydrogenase family protein [Cyanobacteria bacterium P01_H01_bin.35]